MAIATRLLIGVNVIAAGFALLLVGITSMDMLVDATGYVIAKDVATGSDPSAAVPPEDLYRLRDIVRPRVEYYFGVVRTTALVVLVLGLVNSAALYHLRPPIRGMKCTQDK
jgi:hypothetical protein